MIGRAPGSRYEATVVGVLYTKSLLPPTRTTAAAVLGNVSFCRNCTCTSILGHRLLATARHDECLVHAPLFGFPFAWLA